MIDKIKFLKKIQRSLILLRNAIIPRFLIIRTKPEEFSIKKFIEFVSKEVKEGERVLDTGAGKCPYKKYFSHTQYESTDFEDIFEKDYKENHNFICNLEKIPKADNFYDAILNTQVLEHIEHPQKVIEEFYRILKPGGKLFLTAPQESELHGEPYHFFNFTKYGLKALFKKAGFKIIFIKPRGGIFWFLAYKIKKLPSYIFYQYLFEREKDSFKISKIKIKPGTIILFPFYLISIPFSSFIFPLIFFYLDKLDKKKNCTLGYMCYCLK